MICALMFIIRNHNGIKCLSNQLHLQHNVKSDFGHNGILE